MRQRRSCACADRVGFGGDRPRIGGHAPRTFQEAAAEGGQLRYVQGIPVLFLAGDPEQMGRQQAALVLDAWRGALGFAQGRFGQARRRLALAAGRPLQPRPDARGPAAIPN